MLTANMIQIYNTDYDFRKGSALEHKVLIHELKYWECQVVELLSHCV